MVTTLMKSTLREIRAGLGRYLAIMAIIALGVGVYGGLTMSQPSMMDTGVEYIEAHRLFDFRLMSTLGFTQEDVDAFAAMEGVDTARGAVFADFLVEWNGEEESVFTALSLTDDINEPMLLAGWMPQNPNECLGDARFFSEADLGKTITVSASNDEDTRELMARESYTLVGLMQTPYYLSNIERGTSAIGGGTVAAYIYIPESGFDFDAYFDVFLKLENAAESYSEAYKAQIDDFRSAVEALTEERADLRYDTIYGDAMDELSDAEREIADGWEEYRSEKEKVQRELSDARDELTEGEREYADGLAELEQGRADYADGMAQYGDGAAKLADAERELSDAGKELADAKAELDEVYAALEDARSELDEGEKGYSDLATLYGSAAQMAQMSGMGSPGQLIVVLESGAMPQLNAMLDQNLQAQGSSLEAFLAGWNDACDAAGQEPDEAYLASLRATLDAAQAEYGEGLALYEEGLAQYESGQAEYEDALEQYEAGTAELETAERELSDAAEELAEAEVTLADARAELDDGWAEYEEGLAEAEAEFADAETELLDAESELAEGYEELEDLERPDTFVLTRSENTGYASFDNDTSIVAAVAVVFPVFFFLVAALVCVTTMTRMVDEQRTQIGVLKALGYSNARIMGKYIIYSGSAAVVGSALGYALGSTAMPWVIWQIYGIMYSFAPLNFLFDPLLAVLTFAAALLCSAGSTFIACRAELREAAAELIRPKTPKAGKRVLLEYVTPLWKRLSFLHKVSVRNVLRYRSRLIMMVLGIGGCTALLVTGFGLKDSLTSVIDEQFEKITFYDYSVAFHEEPTEKDVQSYLAAMGREKGLLVHSGSVDVVTDYAVKSTPLVISATDSLEGYISLHRGGEEISYPGKDEAVINEGLAERLRVQEGDRVTLRRDGGAPLSVTVSGICDNFVGNYIYLSRETYERQTGEAPAFKTLYLHEREGEDPYAESVTLADWDGVSRVTANEVLRTQVRQMLERLDLLVLVIVICAGALAFIVLYNLTNINITERIREIATIKVLGFFRGEVASYVYREIYMLSALGSIAGIFMGRALHAFVMAQVKIDAVYFPCIVHPASYAISVALTLVFTVLISLVMRPRLAGIRMAESLKSVE